MPEMEIRLTRQQIADMTGLRVKTVIGLYTTSSVKLAENWEHNIDPHLRGIIIAVLLTQALLKVNYPTLSIK